MLALARYRSDEICPLCGWPREVCQAPETEWALEVPPPTRCHVTTAMNRAQDGWAANGGKGGNALLWGARYKGSAALRQSP